MTKKELIVLIVICVAMAILLVVFALFFLFYRKSTVQQIENGDDDLSLLQFYRKNVLEQKKKKVVDVIKKTLYILSLLVIGGVLIYSLCYKFGAVDTGATSVVAVRTGSMSFKNEENDYLFEQNLNDQFPRFSLIVVEKVDPSELKQFDVVVYINPQGERVIHRIKEIAPDGRFIMRGDANNGSDDYHPYPHDVEGIYTGKYIPVVGIIVLFVQSYIGIVTMIALIVCLALIDVTRNKIAQARELRLNHLCAVHSIDDKLILSLTDADLKEMLNISDDEDADKIDDKKKGDGDVTDSFDD